MSVNPFPPRPCPADILAVLDSNGELTLTRSQLRRLISWEAEQLGYSFDQAQALAHAGTLAVTALGCDIDLLFRVLESGADIGEAMQWHLDHPDGISAEELEAMDRYAAESCREEGCR